MDYRTEAPPLIRDFLVYHETIQGHSRQTVDEYYLDLRSFARYLKQARDPSRWTTCPWSCFSRSR